MNWKHLETTEQVEELIDISALKPQVIFKHSSRCVISIVAKGRLDKHENNGINFHLIDVLKNRNLSNHIADNFSIHHESPQVLVIKNGTCIFDESHSSIMFDEIMDYCN